MLPLLHANPTNVLIDLAAGELTGTASIEYAKEASQVVWHRSKPGGWEPVALQVTTAGDDPALIHGYFVSPDLDPGDMYQVAIWDGGIDPNKLGPETSRKPIRAVASTVVLALRRQPGTSDLLRDKNGHTGGTFRSQHVATRKPVFARFKVGTRAPERNGFEPETISNPVSEVWAGMDQSCVLDALDLIPGTHYWGHVLMVDASGEWHQLSLEFTTLQRRVRVVFNSIFVRDDGDDFSNGEAAFFFALEVGNVGIGKWIERATGQHSNENLETGKAISPAPNVVLAIGPEVVSPESLSCRVKVLAVQDDTGLITFGSLQQRGASLKDLFIPIHTIDEVVIQRADQLRVKAQGADFSVDAHFIYSIEYF